MTHDERIEAMARAMHAADVEPRKFDPHWIVRDFDELNCIAKGWWHRMATAALAAAGVEEMVREAAFDGFVQGQNFDGFDNRVGTAATIDDIVREVMGK
jgi:hypothetical protein